MIIDYFLTIIAIVGLTAASVSDLKTREVPDWLSYSLISSAIFLRLIFSLNILNFSYFLYGLLGFSIAFIIGTLMYYTKQWGGGDSKLIMALGAIFITNPFQENFLLSLAVNILIFGALYGIFWSLFLAIKNKNKFLKEFKVLLKKGKTLRILSFILSLSLILTSLLIKDALIKIAIIALAVIIFFYIYLILTVKAVENSCMYKKISSSKLTEGDWIINDIKSKNKLIYSKKSPGVNKKQIEQIKKLRIKNIIIKEGIPFVPSFLIATIITLLLGNILYLFI